MVGNEPLIDSSLGLGHGMAIPLHSLEPGSVGEWLAVPQTQLDYLRRAVLGRQIITVC